MNKCASRKRLERFKMSREELSESPDTGSASGSSLWSLKGSTGYKCHSGERSKEDATVRPHVRRSELDREIKIIRRRRIDEETETKYISKSTVNRISHERSRSPKFSSSYSSRSHSRRRSPERRKRTASKSEIRISSCSRMRRSRSSDSSSKFDAKGPQPLFLNPDKSPNASSSGINFDQVDATPADNVLEAKTDSLDSTPRSEAIKREFLEAYISRLKSQIFYKDNKLCRLQNTRASPKVGVDKDTMLQNTWEQQEVMYEKFQVIEKELETVTEEKLKMEIIIKKLEKDAELHAAELHMKNCMIATLTGGGEVDHMQAWQQTNEQLKNHYERELGKKLELYRKQCADFVSTTIRTYQMSNRYLQLQLLSLMGNQIGHRRHEMDSITHLKPNLVDRGSESTVAAVSSISFPLPFIPQQHQPDEALVECEGITQGCGSVQPPVSVPTSENFSFIMKPLHMLVELGNMHTNNTDSECESEKQNNIVKQEVSVSHLVSDLSKQEY